MEASPRWLQLGIAARLAISFIAVACLAVAANLLVEGRVPVLQTTEIRYSAPEAPVRAAAKLEAAPAMAAPAPAARPEFPSSSPVMRAIDRLEKVVDAGVDADVAETNSRYEKQAAELDHAVAAFAVAAAAAGESPPVRFTAAAKSYRRRGLELINLTQARRARMADYSAHFELLNARVKKSLDHAWTIFGRVVARQSLVKLTSDLDGLRRRYVEFISSATADSSTYDALGASEANLAQTLAQDEAGFSRAEGKGWVAESQADLQALSGARKELLRIERDRRNLERGFAEDAAALNQILAGMGKTETFVAPARDTAAPAWDTAAPARDAATPARGADTPVAAAAVSIPAPRLPSMERRVTTTALDPNARSERVLVAWLSGGVMLLVVCISVATALSIVLPVRRLLVATSRIANGERAVSVPRGGIRELDTLAVAFNDMAAQLNTARDAARDQQHQLEAKVAERTRQLQELAELDPLTRLANRRQFFTLLDKAIEAARNSGRLVGIYFLDIDNFKNINDSLGHEFGDRVLQTMAARLADATRLFGFAARLGGDEFTVVYESAHTKDEIRIAGEDLVNAFQQPVPLDGRDLIVSVSAGASIFPDHAHQSEALLRAADAALYEAKALGRSRLAVFTPALLEAATARFTIEQDLRRAVQRGEFELVFQPEVNLQTCEVELVEALLRWRLPDGRVISPAEFLPVAEASGLILQINDWVLRHVVEMAARWYRGAWPQVRVAINVSSRQLFDDSFDEQVVSVLEEFALPTRCIEIELTENVLQTGSATINSLRRLRAHGIAIALDDFGTGFSSLTSLEQLPLTRIKLDRSLIASIDTSARSVSIARAIIQLCQGLGLAITAEGIERTEQLGPLLGFPSLYGQGYLLARPQSPEDLMRVLTDLPALTRRLIQDTLTGACEPRSAHRLRTASQPTVRAR